MGEFFQSNGIWVVFGLLFALMLWSHTRRRGMGGCGGGGHDHGTANEENQQKDEKPGSGCH